MRVALVQQVITPSRHHSHATRTADAFIGPRQHHGSQPAAGQARAADSGCVHIGPRGEVIQGALIVEHEYTRPGHPGAEQALCDLILVPGRELVVALDLVFGLRVRFHKVVANVPRHIRQAHPAASESERVVYHHNVAAARQFIGPGQTAVVLLLMPKHGGMRVVRHAGDFPQAEVFISAVVMQPDNAG